MPSYGKLMFIESFKSDGKDQRYTSARQGTFNGLQTAKYWHCQRQSGNTNRYTNITGNGFRETPTSIQVLQAMAPALILIL